jgi:hypothetical protein
MLLVDLHEWSNWEDDWLFLCNYFYQRVCRFLEGVVLIGSSLFFIFGVLFPSWWYFVYAHLILKYAKVEMCKGENAQRQRAKCAKRDVQSEMCRMEMMQKCKCAKLKICRSRKLCKEEIMQQRIHKTAWFKGNSSGLSCFFFLGGELL